MLLTSSSAISWACSLFSLTFLHFSIDGWPLWKHKLNINLIILVLEWQKMNVLLLTFDAKIFKFLLQHSNLRATGVAVTEELLVIPPHTTQDNVVLQPYNCSLFILKKKKVQHFRHHAKMTSIQLKNLKCGFTIWSNSGTVNPYTTTVTPISFFKFFH